MLSSAIRRLAIAALVGAAVVACVGHTEARAASTAPVTVNELRLYLLNHDPRRAGRPVELDVSGQRFVYAFLDLMRHPGKGLEVSDTPASKRYDNPRMAIYVPLLAKPRCRAESKAAQYEYATVADGRYCWTHYKAGAFKSDPKLNPAYWSLTLVYRNIVVTWDFTEHRYRYIPPGVFAFDALMTRLLAAH